MNYQYYSFTWTIEGYFFYSVGRRRIKKAVVFTPMRYRGMFNLALGDVLPNGRIDDAAVSNNGDMIMVVSTIIHIVVDFLSNKPAAIIFFRSDSETRIKLYNRILIRNHGDLKIKFEITKLIKIANHMEEVSIGEKINIIPYAFLVRLKY